MRSRNRGGYEGRMKPKVLILASRYDFSVDLVALELERRRVPFARVNKEDLAKYRFSFDPSAPILSFSFRGEPLGTSEDVAAIWFRQPVFLRNAPPNPLSPAEQLSRSQWPAFIRGLSVLDQAGWMNWPQSTYLAESKPYQLLMASRCGLKVPKTLAGNDASAIKSTFRSDVVIKSLDTVLVRDDEDCLFTYTSRCRSEAFTDAAVQQVPIFVQELVQPKVDHRVTVIGSEIVAVKILADGSPVSGDWRLVEKKRLSYVDSTLPKEVEDGCRCLVARLGLHFGAIDLLETRDGFFFLEINPTGEWGWLNNERRRFDEKIADWLSSRP